MKKLEKSSKRRTGLQGKSFLDAARELGCDEDEAAFNKMLKKLGSAPPPKSVQKRKGRNPAK